MMKSTRNKRYTYKFSANEINDFNRDGEGLIAFKGDLQGARWDGHEYKVPDGGWRKICDSQKDNRILGVDGLSDWMSHRHLGLTDAVYDLMSRILQRKPRIHRVSGQIILPQYRGNKDLPWEAREDFLDEIWDWKIGHEQIDGAVDSNVFVVSRLPHLQVSTALKIKGAIIVPAGTPYLSKSKRNVVQDARNKAKEDGIPFDYHREFGSMCGTCPVTILYLNPNLSKDRKIESWIRNKILLTKELATGHCSGGNKTTDELADIYKNLRNVGLQIWEDAYRG